MSPSYKHAAPLGLKRHIAVYRHIAPLKRKAIPSSRFPALPFSRLLVFPLRIGRFGTGQLSGKAVRDVTPVSGQGPALSAQILKRFVVPTKP